jgi:transcriptional regulator with XRE-family HTH domain
MVFSGNQLRAARSLLGLDQAEFAKLLGVAINTVRIMEGHGAGPVGGLASTRERVCESLKKEGVEFLNDGEPGVRLRKGRKSTSRRRGK